MSYNSHKSEPRPFPKKVEIPVGFVARIKLPIEALPKDSNELWTLPVYVPERDNSSNDRTYKL